jgi:hypothetical protein
VTTTVVAAFAVPPGPVAVIAYSVVAGGHTRSEPAVATLPGAGRTDALDALVELHVSVVHAPVWMEDGVAEIVAVGRGGGGGGGGAGADGGGAGGGAWTLTGQRALALAIASFAAAMARSVLHVE